jgi:hypothetical protein
MKISSASCITFSKENQMTKKPHADTGLAKHIERRVLELKSKKSQLQIASEAGFPNPNMVTMIKTGTSKLALDRVPSMARALDVIPPSCCAWGDVHSGHSPADQAKHLIAGRWMVRGDGKNLGSKAPSWVAGRPRVYKIKADILDSPSSV